ncbi:MAG: tRNA (adenosine(37)-N6)-dimethylallyltransferase MiaA [Acidobacteriota bacterium]
MQPLLVILGPTASGKSSLAVELARRLDGEIVNADALQVYRGLDVGTDKPTLEMRRRVPHHLVDVLDPDEPWSAGAFGRMARDAIEDIRSRGLTPLVVGGSGLYLRALLEGLGPLPRSQPEVRRELEARLSSEGLPSLYAELSRLDPETAARLAPRDRQRIVRALEVYRISGETMSAWLARRTRESAPLEGLRIGLTVPRTILYDRIADRIMEMVENGWIAEVVALLNRGIQPSVPAFQAIGYRQMVRHIMGEYSLENAVAETVQATRRYAKRQMTWFRREDGIRWVPGLEVEAAASTVLRFI